MTGASPRRINLEIAQATLSKKRRERDSGELLKVGPWEAEQVETRGLSCHR